MAKFRKYQRTGLGAVVFMAMMFMPATGVQAEPFADRVAPQRLTLFVGQGEQRIRIEGHELEEVDEVVAYDTSDAGQSYEVPEVKTRILNVDDGVMTLIVRADASPANGRRVQLALMFGHQGYMIPANVFEMEVR